MKQLKISTKLTNRDVQSFNQYLKEISDIDVFTPEQEVICTEKASKGDQDAIDELVRRNLRFVVSVAKQYATPMNPLEDLVNEGNIGLMLAAQKFRPEMGFKFISYAVWWVRKIIMEHLTKNGRMVRLPANKVNSLSKLDKQIHILEQKLGRNVSIIEVVEEFGSEMDLGFDMNDKSPYKKLKDEYQLLDVLNDYNMDSLDREIGGDDGNGTTLADTITDNFAFKATDQSLMDEDVTREIFKVLDTLKPRDRHVMVSLFGLGGGDPKTLKEVGDEIGVTREMVRQIREKSLKKLQVRLKNSEILK
jgi:RNA polymerase primary sigma factor